jgi:hypothetical protein
VAGSLQAFPLRVDLSVNKANVDNAQSTAPVLTTRTGTSTAGAYNGGGTGNKAILGIQGFDGFPLSALLSLEVVWKEVAPAQNPLAMEVYVNLIVEPDPVGHPGVYKIFVVSNTDAPILCFTETIPTPGTHDYTWLPAPPVPVMGPNVVQVVGPVSPNTFKIGADPAIPSFNPVPPGTIWQSQCFTIASILAQYPSARLRDVNSGDGGLPAATVTPAILIIVGDSGNTIMASRLIEHVRVNGNEV